MKISTNFKPFTILFHQTSTIEDWTTPKKLTAQLFQFATDKVDGGITLKVYPRHLVQEVWDHETLKEPYPFKPYSFRAFAKGNTIILLDDDTETKGSLFWVLLHEMAHVFVSKNEKLKKQFRHNRKEVSHETSPEEQFANLMADQWFFEYTGIHKSYHRLWWKERCTKLGVLD